MFSPRWAADPETGQPGLRGDFDLIAEWTADKVATWIRPCDVNQLDDSCIKVSL